MEYVPKKFMDQAVSILDKIKDIVLLLDSDGNIIFYNDAFLKFMAVEELYFLRVNIREVLDNFDEVAACFETNQKNRVIIKDLRFRYLSHEVSILEARIEFWKFEEGDRGFLIIGRNVTTERKNKNEIKCFLYESKEEVLLAREVQKSLLPASGESEKFIFETFFLPLGGISGDYACVYAIGEKKVYLTLCDVSGHGVGAALLANRINSKVYGLLKKNYPCETVVRVLNDFLIENFSETGLLPSFICIELNVSEKSMTWSGAGHPPFLFLSAQMPDEIIVCKSQRTLIGLKKFYPEENTFTSLPLASGDKLLVYSDALIEIKNDQKDQMGFNGLKEVMKNLRNEPLEKFGFFDHLIAKYKEKNFYPFEDDMTGIFVTIK